MKIVLTEYYEGDSKKTPLSLDADKQQLGFIFPEETKDNAVDGGIQIR